MIKPYQQRVIDEKSALDYKIRALAAFIEAEAFPAVPELERERMSRQLVAMRDYSAILAERIDAF